MCTGVEAAFAIGTSLQAIGTVAALGNKPSPLPTPTPPAAPEKSAAEVGKVVSRTESKPRAQGFNIFEVPFNNILPS